MLSTSKLSCRFYAEKLPSVDEVLMVRVTEIADLGAYVKLLEYDNMEGMMMLSELSRRRIRSVNKLIRVGRLECVIVTRVDKEKNYIDLSKRRVTREETQECLERYSKAKCIHSILRRVAEMMDYNCKEQLEKLYRQTAWYFDRKHRKKAQSYNIFKMAVGDPSILDECNIDAKTKEVLLSAISLKIPQIQTTLRSTLEVTCFEYEGIDAIKHALTAGKACSTDDIIIRINLIAPPLFVMNVTAYDHVEAAKLMEHAISVIEEKILAFGGSFKLVSKPKAVTDRDEEQMAKLFNKLQLENNEVPGDVESSEEDEGEEPFMFENLP